jgi:hypothetical protein
LPPHNRLALVFGRFLFIFETPPSIKRNTKRERTKNIYLAESWCFAAAAALLFPQTNEGQRLLYLCAQHPFYYTNLLHTYAPRGQKKQQHQAERYIFSLLYIGCWRCVAGEFQLQRCCGNYGIISRRLSSIKRQAKLALKF